MANSYDQFMNKPLRLKTRIEHKADEVAFLFEVCTKATGSWGEKVQTSPTNRSERNKDKYIDESNKLLKMIDEYEASKDEVITFLYDNLKFEDADLLEWKYINGKTLTEIAKIKGIAYQTAKNRSWRAERDLRIKFGTKKY